MDYFTLQMTLKAQNPGKNITYTFDSNCLRQAMGMFNNNAVNFYHHVQYNKVLVKIDSANAVYYDLDPFHTINYTLADYKALLNSYTQVNLQAQQASVIDDLQRRAAQALADANNPLNILRRGDLLALNQSLTAQVNALLGQIVATTGQTLENVTNTISNILKGLLG